MTQDEKFIIREVTATRRPSREINASRQASTVGTPCLQSMRVYCKKCRTMWLAAADGPNCFFQALDKVIIQCPTCKQEGEVELEALVSLAKR